MCLCPATTVVSRAPVATSTSPPTSVQGSRVIVSDVVLSPSGPRPGSRPVPVVSAQSVSPQSPDPVPEDVRGSGAPGTRLRRGPRSFPPYRPVSRSVPGGMERPSISARWAPVSTSQATDPPSRVVTVFSWNRPSTLVWSDDPCDVRPLSPTHPGPVDGVQFPSPRRGRVSGRTVADGCFGPSVSVRGQSPSVARRTTVRPV